MLSRSEFAELRKDMAEALASVSEKYGVHVTIGKIKYSSFDCSVDVKLAKRDPTGKSQEQADFERLCTMYGFKPEDYLKPFKSDARNFVLIGFNPRAKSMPFLGRDAQTGTPYKFSKSAMVFK